MKKLLALIIFTCVLQPAFAQALKKYAVGITGCSVSFYCDPGKFEASTSPDSSVIYTGECTAKGITYDLICVKLVQKAPDLAAAEQVVEQYLDYLKRGYEIAAASGYTRGLRLKKKENTRGMSDTWKDKDGNNIKIKGWTDGTFLAVTIVISPKVLLDAAVNPFLDSIVFPAK